MKSEINEIEVNGVAYIRKDSVLQNATAYNTDGLPYVIIRSRDSGCHASVRMKEKHGHRKDWIRQCADRIEELERENQELRQLFPLICEAIGNGSGCSADSSVEFLKEIPTEISTVIQELRQKLKVHEDDAEEVVQCGFALGMDNARREIDELRKDRERLEFIMNNCTVESTIWDDFTESYREVEFETIDEIDAAMSDKANKTGQID